MDSVLLLMDMFAMPYKAVVLRLYESSHITRFHAERLLEINTLDMVKRMTLTGKAKRWQLSGKGTESFGTLLEKIDYNIGHDYLTESRKLEDLQLISSLKKELCVDADAFPDKRRTNICISNFEHEF